MLLDGLGPFDEVLDVGGNVGEFAELCRSSWPGARVTSYEPIPGAANANRRRARGRWWVEELALGAEPGVETLHVCINQHSASSLHRLGPVRRTRFGIRDQIEDLSVTVDTLDRVAPMPLRERVLLKVDVEGHELDVLHGAAKILRDVAVCVVEVSQAEVFVGAPTPDAVDDELRRHGLYFHGVCGVQLDPQGEVVQFDGVWSR